MSAFAAESMRVRVGEVDFTWWYRIGLMTPPGRTAGDLALRCSFERGSQSAEPLGRP